MKIILGNLILAFFILSASNAFAVTRYADLNSPNSTSPYTDWGTAATNIQDAVDAAVAGDLVLVTNGVYQIGGRPDSGDPLTNRVAVTKAITLQSVNGPLATIVQGYKDLSTTNGGNSVRGFLLKNKAQVIGFTISGGGTRTNLGGHAGGGVFCLSTSEVLSNCIIINNSAASVAGVINGTLRNCVISNNSAVFTAGGAAGGNYFNCLFTANSAQWAGAVSGGGPPGSILNNCTVVGNSASVSGGGVQLFVGDVSSLNLRATNSIIYENTAPVGANYSNLGQEQNLTLDHCCTVPLPATGNGNFTNPPVFVSDGLGDYRLQPESPCINAGRNMSGASMTDLDYNFRNIGGTVDVGAYEYQTPTSVLSYAWAQQNGLSTDGSADFSDADGDGANNWQEWRADTIPTNAVSALRLVSATNSQGGAVVTWQSVATRNYWLDRATNLGVASPFQTIATNIVGASGTKTYTDPTATGGGQYFYRVGVQ